MEQGWKYLFSELNMHCAGRITLLWGSHNVQAARQGATSDNSLRMKQVPFKCCCNNHAA